MRIVFWITATVLLLGGLFSDVVDGQRFFRPIRRKLERLIILNIDIKYSNHYIIFEWKFNDSMKLIHFGIIHRQSIPSKKHCSSSFPTCCSKEWIQFCQEMSIWLPYTRMINKLITKGKMLNLIFILYFTITIGRNLSISSIRKKIISTFARCHMMPFFSLKID